IVPELGVSVPWRGQRSRPHESRPTWIWVSGAAPRSSAPPPRASAELVPWPWAGRASIWSSTPAAPRLSRPPPKRSDVPPVSLSRPLPRISRRRPGGMRYSPLVRTRISWSLTPGDFRGVDREAWIRAVDANMLTPIFLIRAVIDGMIARGFGRIVNITTSGVKNPAAYPPLGVSIGVRFGLTGFVAVLSRQVARHNVTINGLLPGRFETD